jgi:hypothetical protein
MTANGSVPDACLALKEEMNHAFSYTPTDNYVILSTQINTNVYSLA